MKWEKLGQIFLFKPIDDYLITHASNPLAIQLNGNIYRILFSGRNKENKSSVGFVDINIITREVINTCKQVIFQYGDDNSFFSHGVSIGNSYSIDKKKYILFMAWQIRNGEHWKGVIGRLRMDNNKNLILNPKRVFFNLTHEDKISLSYPWVLFDDGQYKMWYGSTIDWNSPNGEMIHVIKYAISYDGISWIRKGLALAYEIGVAQAFSRPTVVKDKNGYHMWFSFRPGNGTKYRIGYAHSIDGVNWVRRDDSGISVSPSGWDSKMICYPFVFEHNSRKYMLYNGNAYGKTGFGLAILEE